MLKGIEAQLALLATQSGDGGPVRDASRIDDTRQERIVSRYQPNDSLYRSLHATTPWFKDLRTPDLDHWNATWLRGFIANDVATMKMATVKSMEAAGLLRANEDFEGVLSGTDLTDGTGGHLLPQPYANLVDTARAATAVVARLCTNFTTEGATLRVPTSGAVTADTAAEGAAPAQSNPLFTSEMMILHKIGARMIASDEMVADAAFNLMEIYGRRAGEAIGVAEDTQILTTAGVSPDLTEKLAGGDVTESIDTQLSYKDLPLLFFTLGKAYQPNGTWLAGTLLMQLLSQMVDSTGQPMLKTPSSPPQVVTDATPQAMGTVLGRPIYHVPATAGVLLFGDLRSYAILRKGGIEAKMSNEVGWATDTVQFKFTERIDGRIIDDVGMKQFANIASLT